MTHTLEEVFNITWLLGISARAKTIQNDLDIHDMLRKGLPKKAVRSLLKKTGFDLKELSIAVPISLRTLQNLVKDVDQRGRLSPQQSDALWQFATVFEQAQQLTGTTEYAKEWLCSDARSLGYRKPIEVLSFSPGMTLVMRVIHQIRHGIFI